MLWLSANKQTMKGMFHDFSSSQTIYELLDKHVSLKNIKVVDIPLNELTTDNIRALKSICRKMSYFGGKLVLQLTSIFIVV